MDGASARARVSVALCTHNGALFIEQQLRSILAQDPAPWEVILSDDASTDDTIAIAERVSRDVESASGAAVELVILSNAAPLGVTANFEQAITMSRGEVIALSDQDDVWHEGRLAKLVAVLAARPAALVVASDATLTDSTDASLGVSLFETLEVTERDLQLLNGSDPFSVLMHRNILTGATMVLRRELLEIARPFPRSWVHDEWIAVMAAAMGEVAVVGDELIDYRQHGSNQIGARRATLRDKIMRLTEPRSDRNARLLARAEALVDRTETHADMVRAGVWHTAKGKLEHERARSTLPASRFLRVLPVLAAGVAGRYRKFGRGLMDMARDIFQPSH